MLCAKGSARKSGRNLFIWQYCHYRRYKPFIRKKTTLVWSYFDHQKVYRVIIFVFFNKSNSINAINMPCKNNLKKVN